jgi:hypothetical protein
MSSFNMVADFNKLAPMVLHALNLESKQIPRFRDAYLDIDEPGRPKLVIMTRTGGPYRKDYIDENKTISGLAGFISDRDDPFDHTFAYWSFEVPPNVESQIKALIAKVVEMSADPLSGLDPEVLMKPMDRFHSRIADNTWDVDPAAQQLTEVFRKAGLDGKSK